MFDGPLAFWGDKLLPCIVGQQSKPPTAMKRKSRNFSISLSPEMVSHLDARAEASGLNRSAYIESVLTRAFAGVNELPPEIPPPFRIKDARHRKHKRTA